jgi:hypothetical protein
VRADPGKRVREANGWSRVNLHDDVCVPVDKLSGPKKVAFVALAALAIVLAVNAPSQARGMGGHAGGAVGHGAVGHGFDGHHGFDGRRFDRRFGFGFGFDPFFPYYGYYPYYPPAYTEAPAYWYYCRAMGRTIRTWRVARRRGCRYRLHDGSPERGRARQPSSGPLGRTRRSLASRRATEIVPSRMIRRRAPR